NSVAGTYAHSYPGILAGATCTVTETSDGGSSTVHVVTVGSPQTVTISADGTATADLTDTYTQVPGSLVVTKDITGPAAGSQGAVSIAVSCDDSTIGTFDIAAAATGPQSKTFSGIQAGSACEVTETQDGSSSTVDVTVTGDGQTVTIPANGAADATITDAYSFANGSLTVNKTIAGPGAGQQGQIVIGASCDGNSLDDFVIPANQAAGTYTHEYPDLPAGSVCTVLEAADGSTGRLAVRVKGSGSVVTIPAGAEATVELTDTYESGVLVINKTITGPAAGSQGPVKIEVSCNGTALPPFEILTGTSGTVSMSYPNILAGSTCSLTETATGATERATVTTVGSPQDVTISENGTATANVVNTYQYVPGALVVTKAIAGAAAGQQGQVSIGVSCALDGAETALDPFVIPAGQPAGIVSHTYEDVPAGSTCTVQETQDGSTSTVSVETVGGSQSVAIPAGDEVVANITDTYYLAPPVPGELTVTKTIAGPAAGQQGTITISVSCNGTAQPDFVISAGSSAGTLSRSYSGIPAGSTCKVTETGNGASGTVLAVTEGSPQTVDISANGTGVANVTDTYSKVPIPVGSLTVTKTVTGPAAGQQGAVTVIASCNGRELSPVLEIPAGATGAHSQTYPNLPAGSVCSATAGPDGGTSTVHVSIAGDGNTVSIPSGGDGTVALTDTYTSVPGSLVVTKTIAGPAAGQQGAVTVRTVCSGSALSPELTVPAGAAAGAYSQTYDGLPAGTTCTLHEVANGSTSAVSVTTAGAGQTVAVGSDKMVEADVTNTYVSATGSLTVSKTIAGPAAGMQGAVTIETVCNGTALTPPFTVPAGSAAGTSSHKYDGIPAGSTCRVSEIADGSSNSVDVKIAGDGRHVTVPAGTAVTAALADTYSLTAGSLVVTKTIAGHEAGHQGPVSIQVVCDGTKLTPEFTLPAGTAAGTTARTYADIPAGSTCAISELTDGASPALSVTTVGATQHLTVPAGRTVRADITDTYELAPGSLTVVKTITGPAASKQAMISILVDCGSNNVFGLRIPAGTPAGPVPQTFYGIPAGSTCKVVEIHDGHSDTITVERIGDGQEVKVPPGATARADLTDSFTAAAVVTTTTTTVPSTTTTTTHATTTTTTVPSTTTTTPHATTTTTTVPATTTTTKPRVPPVHVVTGYGLWGPGGPTGAQAAIAGLALLAGGAGLVALRLRRRKYRARHLTPGTRRP
ncbi:MAG TPA: DUF5979 domain-containing protein, partial [Acidimicrobiales bacterium]|nr:DUF5979 domain-containing protein [Acidimicrobiales bacterium]